MCSDKTCERRVHCYRYRALANEYRQSYFMDSPREGASCSAYDSTSDCDDRHLTPMDELEPATEASDE